MLQEVLVSKRPPASPEPVFKSHMASAKTISAFVAGVSVNGSVRSPALLWLPPAPTAVSKGVLEAPATS